MRSRKRLLVPALAAVAVLLLPLRMFFFFRDAASTHHPLARLVSSLLRAGELPLWNHWIGGGQPLAGNPNALVFYPTTLLHYLLPPTQLFTAHFLVHLLVAAAGMRLLVLARGGDRTVALIAAASYALSGVAVSMLSLFNLIVVFALAPLVVLATEHFLESASPRDAWLLGAVGGLVGLSGEPVTLAGLGLVLLMIAAGRLQRRHVPGLAISLVTALLIVLPLLLAFSEISGETERAHFPFSAKTVLRASLHPLRLAETFLGPYPGSLLMRDGYLPLSGATTPPLVQSVFFGVLLTTGWLAAPRSARRYAVAGAVLMFLALGGFNPIVRMLVESLPFARIARYPEKFMIAAGLCITVAGAAWLTEAQSTSKKRRTTIAAVLLALAAAGTWLALPSRPMTTVLFAVGSLTAIAALYAAIKGKMRMAAVIHLMALTAAFLFLAPVDTPSPYITPLVSSEAKSVWLDDGDWSTLPARERTRIAASRSERFHGIGWGAGFALMRSPEGMHSWRSRITAERARFADRTGLLHWAQIAGCEAIYSSRPDSAWSRIAGEPPFFRLAIPLTRPMVFAPSSLRSATDLESTVAFIESPQFDPMTTAVVPVEIARFVPATVGPDLIRQKAGDLEFAVRNSGPSVLVLNESYFKAWTLTRDGVALETFPADLDRLGVLLPPGEGNVRAVFGRRHQSIVWSWALSTLLLASAALLSLRSALTAPTR